MIIESATASVYTHLIGAGSIYPEKPAVDFFLFFIVFPQR